MSRGPFYIGIDLGGTLIKGARFDAAGELLQEDREESRAEGPAEGVVDALCTLIERLTPRRASGAPARSAPAGVGVGAAGVLDLGAGVVVESPNLKCLSGFPLRQRLEGRLGTRVLLENDANAAGLGEWARGAGRGSLSMVLLTLGTGVGGAIILDGKLWHGAVGAAGEVGHMCILADGPECQCGSRGCLEALVGARAISERARRKAAEAPESALASCPDPSPEDLGRLAGGGDRDALAIWAETGYYLGIGIANLINIFNPERAILVGGLTGAGEALLAPARESIRRHAFARSAQSCLVRWGELGNRAGVIGAVWPFLEGARGRRRKTARRSAAGGR